MSPYPRSGDGEETNPTLLVGEFDDDAQALQVAQTIADLTGKKIVVKRDDGQEIGTVVPTGRH